MAANSPVFPGIGYWVLVSGEGFIQDPDDPETQVTNLAVGENVFRWTIENGACGSQTTNDLVSIFVYSEFSPDANAGSDQDLCTPQLSTTMSANSPIFPGYGEWTLISGTGILDDPNNGPIITALVQMELQQTR
jgi:hypothetical protein